MLADIIFRHFLYAPQISEDVSVMERQHACGRGLCESAAMSFRSPLGDRVKPGVLGDSHNALDAPLLRDGVARPTHSLQAFLCFTALVHTRHDRIP